MNITNTASDPPHFETDMSARVYFDISSVWAHGQTIGDISTPIYYDAAGHIDGTPTRTALPRNLRKEGGGRAAAPTACVDGSRSRDAAFFA